MQNLHTETSENSLSKKCWDKEHLPITRMAGATIFSRKIFYGVRYSGLAYQHDAILF